MLFVTTETERDEAAPGEDLSGERGPVRTCVGCRERAEKDALVRLAIVPAELRQKGPAILVDVRGRAPGRGVHVHPTRACVTSAVERGGIAKAVRGAPGLTAAALVTEIRERLVERAVGVLGGARRARKLAVGTDAALATIGTASGLILATDAAGKSGELEARANERGIPVVRFLDKMGLGALTRGRVSAKPRAAQLSALPNGDDAAEPQVGVVAILDPGITTEVVRALGRASQLSEAR